MLPVDVMIIASMKQNTAFSESFSLAAALRLYLIRQVPAASTLHEDQAQRVYLIAPVEIEL
jgi:hypothetical protein